MLYYNQGSAKTVLQENAIREAVVAVLDALGPRQRVLVIPPDFTRFHSHAGIITRFVYDYYGERLVAVLPALGTHSPMTPAQIREMFGDMPLSLFKPHDWRNDVLTLGTVPPAYVKEITEGKLDFDWPVQVNRMLVEGGFDLILSIGQVVPHEVIGMANYNKNIFVGTGGSLAINRSHFVGAVYGMERIMGRADTPVRKLFNYGSDHFGHLLPEMVYLDPSEFKSTWLGNKAVYRTRMAMADGGDLLILAPGVKEFGEDPQIDAMIRKYGYFGTEKTLEAVKSHQDLRDNLGAAAHLIHGSSDGRFNITYAPGHLTRQEIEGAGFAYAELARVMARYNPEKLQDGFNRMPDGEDIFFIRNPAIGLWAVKERFLD